MNMNNILTKPNDGSAAIRRYKAKQKASSIAISVFRYIFLIAFSYILLYPLLFMVAHAFRDPGSSLDPTVEWVPKIFSWSAMEGAIKTMKLPNSFFTSVYIEIVSAIFTIISTGVAAYGITAFNFKGKKILNVLLILSILVPNTVLLVPDYINFSQLHLLNTVWTFYLPSICGVGIKAGFCIFIYQQFYKGLPKELQEAAWIDGAGPFKTYVRIVVPSSGVAVLTVSLLDIIWHWNDFYNAQMFLTTPTMAMPLHDFFISCAGSNIENVVDSAMAACLLFVLPMLIMYLILQKKFIASIASTGIVG